MKNLVKAPITIKMSSPSSPAIVDAKVKLQMEKFLLRSNTSNRQLLSKIDTKIVNSDLIFMQKFKKPKKVILSDSKTPLILNSDYLIQKVIPETTINEKFRRMTDRKSSSFKGTTQPNFYSNSPNKLLSHSPPTSTEKIYSIYEDLIKTIKKTSKRKKIRISKPQKKVRHLNLELNRIHGDLEFSGFAKDSNSKGYEKKFKKNYMKEVIDDLKTSKNSPHHELLTQRFTLSNRSKTKFKSIF